MTIKDLKYYEHHIKQARNCVTQGEGMEGSWDFKETERYLYDLYTVYGELVFEKRVKSMITKDLLITIFHRILSNTFLLLVISALIFAMVVYLSSFI